MTTATDNPQVLAETAEKATAISRCDGCGARLLFHPEKDCLNCQHCGSDKRLFPKLAKKLPIMWMDVKNNHWKDVHAFRCNSCGAKEVLSREEIAKSCAFCGTTNVVAVEELCGLRPNALLPFKITKQTAIQRFLAWAKKKFFAPQKFKKYVEPKEVDGVYNPAFTFDTQTITRYSGRLAKTRTVVTFINGKPVTKVITEYFTIRGEYHDNFSDITIRASETLQQRDLDRIQPYGMDKSREYDSNYLHGFVANQYSKTGQACWMDAKGIIDKNIERGIAQKYSDGTIVSLETRTSYNNILFRYILLPVYVGHCKFKNKLFQFFVNGENGKVTGKTPVSAIKVFGVVLGSLILLGGIGALIYFFGIR